MADENSLHVAFLGNSYCRGGDTNVSELTKKLFLAADGSKIRVGGSWPPGEHFGGHLSDMKGEGKRSNLHRCMVTDPKRKWNWVVLQNQSQLPGFIQDDPSGYQRTVEDAKNLNSCIQEHNPGARLMFFMTWGRLKQDKHNPQIFPDFLTMQAKLTAGYLQYVAETSTPDRPTFVAPCGLVYQTICQDLKEEGVDPTSEGTLFHALYNHDGHHPSLAGRYLTAVTIYASLTGKEAKDVDWVPEELDKQGNALDPTVAAKIRDAVSRTITETAATGLIRYPWQ